jgi:hypothetical protein
MLDSDLNPRVEQAEQSQKVAGDALMQLAAAIASALQYAGYPVAILDKQQDTASRQ